jgi:hypothetical protein
MLSTQIYQGVPQLGEGGRRRLTVRLTLLVAGAFKSLANLADHDSEWGAQSARRSCNRASQMTPAEGLVEVKSHGRHGWPRFQ